ncbi:MAG: cobyrinic acid a,c-diamide synthase [Cellvibrionaceae bacterium]|nr:cobyrinic acid a,c-diamide synthase [Cellvibrionaceae bacterium]
MSKLKVECPALLIAAPASGQGKTTVTAALARYHARQGKRVRVFKTGPDFIDPTIHQLASGHPAYQLDLWMVGEQDCQALLYQAAQESDLILIEGVMGMFDGTPSSADLAKRFGLPIVAVIDASAMAQTFGALCFGLSHYDRDLTVAGVVANRVASERHEQLLRESLRPDTQLLAVLPREETITMPERHLGLQLAQEQSDLSQRLDAAADLLIDSELAQLPAAVSFEPAELPALEPRLKGKKIAIAQDAAFAFVYPANLDTLKRLGAELCFFSPLDDECVPECDGLYLPGGYPELHGAALSNNASMMDSIRATVERVPSLAECGGMLYLLQGLEDRDQQTHDLCGVIATQARLNSKVAGLGSLKAQLNGHLVRGHTFHYSSLCSDPGFSDHCQSNLTDRKTEGIYRTTSLLASYAHWYFPSNVDWVCEFFGG